VCGNTMDGIVAPAYTVTACVLHWTAAFLILAISHWASLLRMNGVDLRRSP
jgi:hypothetical protein